MQMHAIPSTGYLRLSQIIGNKKQNIPAIIPVSRTTWLEGVKAGTHPPSINLRKRTVAWRVEDILTLISELGESNSDHEHKSD